jgi:gamma-glutamyltranspeptidase
VAAGRWALGAADEETGFDTWRESGAVRVLLEGQAPARWRDGLEARGHVVVGQPPFSHRFGHAQLIAVEGEHLAGGSDPRPRFGAAVGY